MEQLNLIDTHCHLDAEEFSANRLKILQDASYAGVKEIWLPAVNIVNFQRVKETAETYKQQLNIFPTYGIHPLYLSKNSISEITLLRRWVENERPFAVGEIGVDGDSDLSISDQLELFIEQIKIAIDFALPILVHSRHAVEIILQTLKKFYSPQSKVLCGVFHAFNGSHQQAELLINLGFKIGFGGATTYSGSRQIRRLAKDLPIEAIVLETDAPDIPPVWLREQNKILTQTQGKNIPNTPSQLVAIANVIADIRGISHDKIARQTSENALKIRLQN